MGVYGCCIVRGDTVMIGVTFVCWSGLNAFCVQSSWFMSSTMLVFGSVWAPSLAHFIDLRQLLCLLDVQGHAHSIGLSMLIQESQRRYLYHVGGDIAWNWWVGGVLLGGWCTKVLNISIYS